MSSLQSEGIACSHCGHLKSHVEDSKPLGNTRWRRRRCISCKKLFKTFEFEENQIPNGHNEELVMMVDQLETLTIRCMNLTIAIKKEMKRKK